MLGKTLIIQNVREMWKLFIWHYPSWIRNPIHMVILPNISAKERCQLFAGPKHPFLVFKYFSNSSLFEIGKSEASDGLMVWNSVKYDTIHSMLCEVEQHNFKRLPNQAEYKFSSNHPGWYWRDLGRLMSQSLLSISMFIGSTPNWI